MSVSIQIIEAHIGLLLVDRPQVRNALDWESMQAFSDCIQQAKNMPDLRVLLLSGSSGTFIAGGDLKALREHITPADGERLSSLMTDALTQLEELPCATIAAIDGAARGGGVEIALACDLRVAASDASLGLVQINLGLTPGWGAGQRLLHLTGYSRAFELLASGRVLSAQQALQYGLLNLLAPAGEGFSGALALARQLAEKPAAALQALKRLLRAGLNQPAQTAASLEQAEFPALWASSEHIQAVKRFLDRRGEA